MPFEKYLKTALIQTVLSLGVFVIGSALTAMNVVAAPAEASEEKTDADTSFEKQFTIDQDPLLIVQSIGTEVLVEQGPAKMITVAVSGTDASELVSAEQDGSTITVKGAEGSGGSSISVTSRDGTVVISTGGSKNKRVIVDGQVISDKGNASAKSDYKPLAVKINVPQGSSARFTGVRVLKADVDLSDVQLNMKGTSKSFLQKVEQLKVVAGGTARATVQTSALVDAELSGVSKLHIPHFRGGELKANLSGSSTLTAGGEFGKISIEAKGASKVKTSGLVSGNFEVTAKGASRINHHGKIEGEILKSTSGASRVEIE